MWSLRLIEMPLPTKRETLPNMTKRKLLIVGAGPIGLETALHASHTGFDVTVLEQGRVGEAVRNWQHVQLFTPFSMNSSAAGRRASNTQVGADEILSGEDYVQRYLLPLAECHELQGRVLEHHRVLSCSRRTYGKSDRIGSRDRNEDAFRMLAQTADGEKIFEADLLIDCTGFVTIPRAAGAGGIPCPGEAEALADRHYRIPDIPGQDRNQYADVHSLVIGSGYSAATTVCALADLAKEHPNTRITWVTRSRRDAPVRPVADDPLPERVRLTEMANASVRAGGCVTWRPGEHIDAIQRVNGRHRVVLQHSDGAGQSRAEHLDVDQIIANTGYRPDTQPFGELQIHRCYATDGPIKLAAHLLGEASADCLDQSAGGVDLLKNPEPDFYTLGAAGYGRNSSFLIQTGLAQMQELFRYLSSAKAAAAE